MINLNKQTNNQSNLKRYLDILKHTFILTIIFSFVFNFQLFSWVTERGDLFDRLIFGSSIDPLGITLQNKFIGLISVFISWLFFIITLSSLKRITRKDLFVYFFAFFVVEISFLSKVLVYVLADQLYNFSYALLITSVSYLLLIVLTIFISRKFIKFKPTFNLILNIKTTCITILFSIIITLIVANANNLIFGFESIYEKREFYEQNFDMNNASNLITSIGTYILPIIVIFTNTRKKSLFYITLFLILILILTVLVFGFTGHKLPVAISFASLLFAFISNKTKENHSQVNLLVGKEKNIDHYSFIIKWIYQGILILLIPFILTVLLTSFFVEFRWIYALFWRRLIQIPAYLDLQYINLTKDGVLNGLSGAAEEVSMLLFKIPGWANTGYIGSSYCRGGVYKVIFDTFALALLYSAILKNLNSNIKFALGIANILSLSLVILSTDLSYHLLGRSTILLVFLQLII